ncbi:MAG: amidohydrolase family protein [Holophagales bacterium]|nr:amidohydrolase family protein [Holophagales bacterium]MYG29586.1 amidohydrolase family protein [Holophagales bacterium]MYI79896.1 amidohydrolase family protein [Holophagales bacterium]
MKPALLRLLRIAAVAVSGLTAFAGVALAQATVIQGARVFTGDEVLPTATVVIRGRTIESVTPGADSPASAGVQAEVIDGAGMTLLPGLIDSHTHNFGPALEQALNFGVTTVLDMLTAEAMAAHWRRQQAAGPVPDRADVFAGGPVTVVGGHGTQFGVALPTLDDPEQTEAFIADRVAAGADFIKVIYEAGTAGRPLPTFAVSTLPRIVAAAHSHDLLAVFHISTAEAAGEVIAADADGLVHMYFEGAGGAEVVEAARQAGIFVVPTLAVLETIAATGGGPELAADPLIAPFLTPEQRGGLDRDFGREPDPELMANILADVGALHAAGVPILAGSDAPNPGTSHGASVHRELELLVRAGLTPVEALRAATAAPVDAFDLGDRGRIAAGLKADLILVRGDATADVRATRDIAAIWKDGTRFERTKAEPATGRPRLEPTLLSDFEDLAARTLPPKWSHSTDAFAGGKSTVTTGAVSRDRSGNALRIEGEIKEGFAFPWSGVMVLLGSQFNDPVDAGGIRALAFDARGEGATYQAMAFAESLGMRPAAASFEAGEEWGRIEIPLSSFSGLDPSGAWAFFIGGPTQLGAFWIEIDNVELVE